VLSHKLTTAFCMALLATSACRSTPSEGTLIRIDGSAGVQPLVAAVADEYMRAATARVAVASGLGASARAAAVAAGSIDVAMASHGVDTADLARRGLVAHEIARSAVVFAVNHGVGVAGVTRQEVCDILAGRVTDWNALRGAALPVVAYTRPDAEVDAEVAREHVPCLRGLVRGPHVRVIERPDSMAAALGRTPGAFGVTSAVLVERNAGTIRALALDGVAPSQGNVRSGAYALTRSSYLITRAQPAPHVARFLDFVRGATGGRIITANGAVPVIR
jgi:phosphate transport system substrate-binding protein